jgi:hypothetical protein
MDDQTRGTGDPSEAADPTADERFTWNEDATGTGAHGPRDGDGGGTATAIIEQIREAVDELAVRAAPAVREISARAAELTAVAAVKAAPLAKRAGEVTADASEKLAERSRGWAHDLRSQQDGGPTEDRAPSDLAAEQPTQPDAAPPFETSAESGAEPAFEPDQPPSDERVDPPGF